MWIRNYLISPSLDTVINYQNSKITCQSFCVIYQTLAVFSTMRGEKVHKKFRPHLYGAYSVTGEGQDKNTETLLDKSVRDMK